jgi:bla regulator protein blaR1
MTVIVAWLWQGSAIALGTALLLGLARRQSAATRYVVWWMALVATVLLPVAHLYPASIASSRLPSAVSPTFSDPVLVLPTPPDWLGACLLGAWLGMVLVGLGRIAHGTLAVVRLKRHARPIESHLAESLQAWRDYSGGRRPAALCIARNVPAASALGLVGRPTIALSETLVHSLDRRALDQIVLHEQAHLSRYDDWTRLLQALLSAVCGLHPAVHYIGAQLDIEREAACDAIVVARTGNAVQYARCLADVADTVVRSTARPGLSAAPGALGSGTLLVRVRRLLDPHVGPTVGVQTLAVALAALLLLVILSAAPYVTPTVLVLDSRQALPVVPPRPSSLQAWRQAWGAAAPVLLPSDEPGPAHEPVVQIVTAPSLVSAEPSGRATARSAETPPSLRDVSGVPRPSLAQSHDPLRPEPEPLASRPFSGLSLAPQDGRAANDELPADPRTSDATAVAVVRAGADWSALGDAGVATGRTVAQLGTSTGNGTRRASVAVGGWFGRAGKAVAGRF